MNCDKPARNRCRRGCDVELMRDGNAFECMSKPSPDGTDSGSEGSCRSSPDVDGSSEFEFEISFGRFPQVHRNIEELVNTVARSSNGLFRLDTTKKS